MIISNKIKCKFCGDIIESKNRHDFKFCSCGKCAVDGGHDYLKRSYSGDNPEECFEDLSVVIEENLEEEYLEKLKKIQDEYYDDTEAKHIYEDDLLCELLEKLGFNKIVSTYNDSNKWYA